MHPRNPYLHKKPDFAALSKNHVFLAPFVTIVKGKGHIDFKNKDALRALTRALLQEDFQLDVLIPLDSLVPVIPQRLNYVLWIEDIFKSKTEQLRGVDIGTGGSAIYALLCARKNNWTMVGTDIVQESIDFANKNIQRNGLTSLVQAQHTHKTSSGLFFSELQGKFHFSMCNPPFFASEQETDSLGKSRNLNRPPPSAAKTGTSSELVASGGEIEFLSTMILESKQFSSTVGIFTTMVGIKSDLKFLEDFLKANNASAYTTTSFVQGKTMRWGLAWTFDPQFAPLLTSEPPKKLHGPVQWQVSCSCAPADFILNIKKLLSGLGFKFLVNDTYVIEVVGETNTWSGQRRKRRAAARKEEVDMEPGRTQLASDVASVSTIEFPSATFRELDDPCALHCQITFNEKELGNPKVLYAQYLGGSLGLDAVHQVLQYFRNVYTQHICVNQA